MPVYWTGMLERSCPPVVAVVCGRGCLLNNGIAYSPSIAPIPAMWLRVVLQSLTALSIDCMGIDVYYLSGTDQ